jgi:hypothetical protein
MRDYRRRLHRAARRLHVDLGPDDAVVQEPKALTIHFVEPGGSVIERRVFEIDWSRPPADA